jgi:hypothetical protein
MAIALQPLSEINKRHLMVCIAYSIANSDRTPQIFVANDLNGVINSLSYSLISHKELSLLLSLFISEKAFVFFYSQCENDIFSLLSNRPIAF